MEDGSRRIDLASIQETRDDTTQIIDLGHIR